MFKTYIHFIYVFLIGVNIKYKTGTQFSVLENKIIYD